MGTTRLAIDGGEPVRTAPFPSRSWGASLIGAEELALVSEVIAGRSLFRGYGETPPRMVDDLEAEARALFGVGHALAVSSGTAALHCALAGLGVGVGDEVIVPALMWLSDFNVPVIAGATPVIADIDRTLCLDPADLARKLTARTKAIVVVHFMGGVAQLDRILAVAQAVGVPLIEDCAQSVGASYRGRRLGSWGAVGCYSFQHNKILTSGEGGMLVAADPLVFERAVRFHDLGLCRPALAAQLAGGAQLAPFAGAQYRMGELAGAVALAQLRKIDAQVLAVTRRHHQRLRGELAECCPGLGFRDSGDHEGDAGIALYLDLGDPTLGQWFAKALAAEGIPVGATTSACNLIEQEYVRARRQAQPAMPPFGAGQPGEAMVYDPTTCPNTAGIIGSMVAVMLSQNLSDNDVSDIREAVAKVWHGRQEA